MKMQITLKTLLGITLVFLMAGCVMHRIDWNSRVGSYTFDQAVTEFGPPDKQAKLTDGQLVADWVSRYYNAGGVFVGAGYYGYPGTVGVLETPPSYSESTLRLIFGTNNVLTAWSRH
jgi:hypothetical protein